MYRRRALLPRIASTHLIQASTPHIPSMQSHLGKTTWEKAFGNDLCILSANISALISRVSAPRIASAHRTCATHLGNPAAHPTLGIQLWLTTWENAFGNGLCILSANISALISRVSAPRIAAAHFIAFFPPHFCARHFISSFRPEYFVPIFQLRTRTGYHRRVRVPGTVAELRR